IVPSLITIYPGDRQTFTCRANPLWPLWEGSSTTTVQEDFTLLLDASADGDGTGGHQLVGGVGVIEFQITDFCRPTSTGSLQWVVYVNSPSGFFQYTLIVLPTQLTIKNELSVTIATVSYTTASGDVFRLEISNLVKLYVNNVLKHSLTAYSGVARYPATYAAFLARPVAAGATAIIPRPALTGDWQLRPIVAFTAPAVGSLTASSGIKTEYFNGTTPGIYTLTGQVDASEDPNGYQRGTATIVIAPLSIIGDTAITMQPSSKARFKTSYDNAQSATVTWSVVSGSGSFSNGEFTAPSAAGTTVVRATSGNQAVDITITIPTVITQSLTAAQPGELVTFQTNLTGSITWSATAGTTPGSGTTFAWTAPGAAGQRVRITATNGTTTLVVWIEVLKLFPYQPNGPIESTDTKNALISSAEDGTRSSRVKNKNGNPAQTYDLTFEDRDKTEFAAVRSFWNEHYPGKAFILTDSVQNLRVVCYFDSEVNRKWETDCSMAYAFKVIEKPS
ncbi:MAG TPA: hypothetical protein VJ302_30120, partial [Blastocatellia bacterium]|nr:hypothetical protein [Blastocatellia bacterium]